MISVTVKDMWFQLHIIKLYFPYTYIYIYSTSGYQLSPQCSLLPSGFYEICRTYFTPKGGSVADLTVGQQLVSGGIGGFLYWFLTYPTDVVKSAMQSDDIVKRNRKYKGIVDCARKLYFEEGGPPRFFRGFLPCLMRSVPANATMLLVLEKSRQFLSWIWICSCSCNKLVHLCLTSYLNFVKITRGFMSFTFLRREEFLWEYNKKIHVFNW